jgi:prepilin-type N-terminal cleavage/methylation domain-containing protein
MQKGFTIVEILIVIVVIGILASIGLVSYNGYQNRANDTAVLADLDSIAGQLESYRTSITNDNTAHEFPRTKEILETLDIKAAKKSYDVSINYNMTYCIANSGANAYQAFELIARSKSGKIYTMTEDGLKDNTLTVGDMTSTLCTTLGMGLVSNGMYNPDTWQTWVQTS